MAGIDPAGHPRQEDAVLALVRDGVRKTWLAAHEVRAACYPDDLRGPPLALVHDGPAAPPSFAASMGTHINLRITDNDPRIKQAFVFLAVLLPEIVGSGGFVREPATNRLVFWRDPRSAHVAEAGGPNAHHLKRPVLKLTNDQRRIQVVSLGWTASVVDRSIKYGPFLLLNSAILSGRKLPEFEIDDLRVTLHAPPGARVSYKRRGAVREATKLDLLEALLDDVQEPESGCAAGRRLHCEHAVRLARHGLRVLRERDPADAALEFPSSWALKHHVFEMRYRREEKCFPAHGRAVAPGADPLAEAFGPVSILESDIVKDDVRRALFEGTKPAGWTFDEVYGPDSGALEGLATNQLLAGAAGGAPEIFKHLAPPKPPGTALAPEAVSPPIFCDWEGKAHPLPSFLRRAGARASGIDDILGQAGDPPP